MLDSNKIAIIYFSRTVAKEAEHKNWSSRTSKSQRVAISKFLNTRALKTIHSTGLDVLYFDETKQKGNNFGEKIANAFESTFSQGYNSAIMVGNDCIDLPSVNFHSVASALNQGNNVFGPTPRKGTYLIGLNKSDFDKNAFDALSWQTKDLEQDLLSYFESKCASLKILDTLRDANNLHDFVKLLKSVSANATTLKSLKNFLAFELNRIAEIFTPFVEQRTYNFENLRAPPALS